MNEHFLFAVAKYCSPTFVYRTLSRVTDATWERRERLFEIATLATIERSIRDDELLRRVVETLRAKILTRFGSLFKKREDGTIVPRFVLMGSFVMDAVQSERPLERARDGVYAYCDRETFVEVVRDSMRSLAEGDLRATYDEDSNDTVDGCQHRRIGRVTLTGFDPYVRYVQRMQRYLEITAVDNPLCALDRQKLSTFMSYYDLRSVRIVPETLEREFDYFGEASEDLLRRMREGINLGGSTYELRNHYSKARTASQCEFCKRKRVATGET